MVERMTDLERLFRQSRDADILRREAEIQGLNGALEIDAEALFPVAAGNARPQRAPSSPALERA